MPVATPAMPVPVTVPVGARLQGETGIVDLAVVAVGQCPAGHLFLEAIPDRADLDEVTGRQARWAEEHAATCPGPTAA